MRLDLFQPTDEGEARILLLIDAFSSRSRGLEGRTKLAKLDFLIRYPRYLGKLLQARGVPERIDTSPDHVDDIETRMVRYRFGPWDPSYFALLGRLIGKGLITPLPAKGGVSYRVTDRGHELAKALNREPAWDAVAARITLVRRHLDLTGATLKKLIYETAPEIVEAKWGTRI